MPNQVWVTGDTHSDVSRFAAQLFPEQKQMTKDDVVIVCGDFGLLWDYQGESKYEKFWLNWLDSKPFTTLFIDGNHECFPRLSALPEEIRYGAPVGVVRPSVLHLKRGYVYNINGLKTFAFGGAASHDISEGIVNADGTDSDWKKTAERWRQDGKRFFRINNVSWWKDEVEQDPAVYQRGLDNLAKADNKVDLVITHSAATQTENLMGFFEHDKVADYLQTVHDTVQFEKWYYGHYHMDKTFLPHEHCIYTRVERVK